ncbi:MAG TPA: prepilin-type N-terminal cleavage/methylation domain-containing protein [Candidatus Ozemobacteraceae bacterium]|nr:prepilin-type N-terminal cleavage/methylation domain-containing protein [Candidatus Ozemobacteraceae bacterium]HQG27666.1 prepilin-type N-terminal cleavage/methylation domain-containing protein [Candidatus Ozemobacteraceae bacterium]
MMPGRRGFTLVELLVTTVVLSLFLAGAYSLFFGGQKIAGKSAWLQYTITDLRKAEMVITKAIEATSYPTTLLPSAMHDAGGRDQTLIGPNAAQFYVHIVQGLGRKSASSILGANSGVSMYMPRALPERQGFSTSEDRAGVLGWNIFKLERSPDLNTQGNLIWEERETTYSTSAPDYAMALTADPFNAPLKRREVLVRNVEWIDIQAETTGHTPTKITVVISAAYPRESRTNRQGTSAAVPNVGIVANP